MNKADLNPDQEHGKFNKIGSAAIQKVISEKISAAKKSIDL